MYIADFQAAIETPHAWVQLDRLERRQRKRDAVELAERIRSIGVDAYLKEHRKVGDITEDWNRIESQEEMLLGKYI